MFHIVLYEPEIPANTGNIGRLCVALGAKLHLVGRLGFRIDEKAIRRAGLDYWADVDLQCHVDLASFEQSYRVERLFCLSSHAEKLYTQESYRPGDAFLFGSESKGLPQEVHQRHADRRITIPQPSGKVRSLNLACAVAIVAYEAYRQIS
jgi:tRNA (cytidine/uridine-2'-O-)-methyltransferase